MPEVQLWTTLYRLRGGEGQGRKQLGVDYDRSSQTDWHWRREVKEKVNTLIPPLWANKPLCSPVVGETTTKDESFKAFETAAIAGGYVASRFLTGVNPQEFYFHVWPDEKVLLILLLKPLVPGICNGA